MRFDLNITPVKYTNYLSALTNSQGVPNMNVEQFKVVMNIVHLEGRLAQLERLRKQAIKTREQHRYDLEYFNEEKKLYKITKGVEVTVFFRQLLTN